ncbi:MAG: GGDEF domain-containing protein [Methylococcales bacterium]|nr:GGDEF domain-containing protein [Methylococcales bacterium]
MHLSIYLKIFAGLNAASTLLDSADKALYFAKEHGRNQVVLFENIPPPQSNSDANDVELF